MKVSAALFTTLALSVASAQESVPSAFNTTALDGDMQPLILGGTEVPVGQKTYTSGLRRTAAGKDFCGGSLITSKHVLTAAHCFGSIKYVSVGTHYLSGTQDGQQLKVVKQTKHPKRPNRGQSWDFLVLELESEVKDIAPIALAKADGSDTTVGDSAFVMGWGTTSEGGTQSDVLLSVDVQLVSNEDCSKNLSGIDESMLCAGGKKNEDSCQGDSGGPLAVTKDGKDVLVGVVSWGEGCGRVNKPGVYARVSAAREWIDQVAPGVQWR